MCKVGKVQCRRAALTTYEGVALAIVSDELPADPHVGMGMKKVVSTLRRDSKAEIRNRAQCARLSRFISSMYHHQRGGLGSEIKDSIREWTKSLQIEWANSHQLGSAEPRAASWASTAASASAR